MQGVHGEAAFEMLARATDLERHGKNIVHLEIGEPDFDTPSPVVRAGVQWLQKGKTHYAPVNGVRELLADQADNPLIFPPDDWVARIHQFRSVTADEEQRWSEAFSKVLGL